jgi:predicted DCC family thiol-disulfide oxidoreductase YuxK
VDKLIWIYDGDCGFCKRWVHRILSRDQENRIEAIPCQSREREQRFPLISKDACLGAMIVVLPDGKFFMGADGAPFLMKSLPFWKYLAWVFRAPGVIFIARIVYRWVAKNRYRFGSESCDVNSR